MLGHFSAPPVRRTARFALVLLALAFCASLPALSPLNAPGDTLTVIMRPLLNIPAIHVPGETLSITCLAPPTASSWQAELRHRGKVVPLSVTSSQYLNSPDRWELSAAIPTIPVYELYDLRVTASGGIDDTSANAVRVLPTRKTDYYFIHLTDLHLPTRVYYPDSGFDSDSTSVNDFRAVMDDINLINPEFVLLTGDLINEGELEGFAGQYWYGWTQRLLEEFEVPCYVTAGNHDIGGWTDTPPPAGSSRRNWWRYFGWPWLDNPDSNWPLHTQDYDFTYNDLHFIGLEAYDNYDNWRANIYGGQSYIWDQINWLNQRLALYPDKTKVLFHHYDFSEQLNLSALGIDLSLWGHIHYNSGSVTAYPYDLATRSVCDGNRAYRTVRVSGGQVQPLSTTYAGYSGANITRSFYPANDGSNSQVQAVVSNNTGVSYGNALLRFKMPPGTWGYQVSNGTLLQIDRGDFNICYVAFEMPANGSISVSISQGSSAADDPSAPEAPLILSAYPNPFQASLSVSLREVRPSLRAGIYNLRGQLVRELVPADSGIILEWDGNLADGSPAPAGVYLLRASDGSFSQTRRVAKLNP